MLAYQHAKRLSPPRRPQPIEQTSPDAHLSLAARRPRLSLAALRRVPTFGPSYSSRCSSSRGKLPKPCSAKIWPTHLRAHAILKHKHAVAHT